MLRYSHISALALALATNRKNWNHIPFAHSHTRTSPTAGRSRLHSEFAAFLAYHHIVTHNSIAASFFLQSFLQPPAAAFPVGVFFPSSLLCGLPILYARAPNACHILLLYLAYLLLLLLLFSSKHYVYTSKALNAPRSGEWVTLRCTAYEYTSVLAAQKQLQLLLSPPRASAKQRFAA